MRNGNKRIDVILRELVSVLTVPMRNGNKSVLSLLATQHIRSYRTYEEWKLSCGLTDFEAGFGSYRTYEEWKH